MVEDLIVKLKLIDMEMGILLDDLSHMISKAENGENPMDAPRKSLERPQELKAPERLDAIDDEEELSEEEEFIERQLNSIMERFN